MTRRLAMVMMAIVATAAIGGCSRAYVNVPAIGGSAASQDPNLPVVRTVEVEALNHVLKRYPPEEGRYAIELPDGTDAATYWWVLRNLPEGGEQIDQLSQDEGDETPLPPVYRVAQVSIQGMTAQVEVVVPSERYQEDRLVSVFLSPDTQGWYANRSRLWNIPAERALRIVRETHGETAAAEQQ